MLRIYSILKKKRIFKKMNLTTDNIEREKNKKLKELIECIKIEIELRKHYLYQQSLTDEFVAPLADNHLSSAIVRNSFHSDTGRISMVASKTILDVAISVFSYMISFFAFALLQRLFPLNEAVSLTLSVLIVVALAIYKSISDTVFSQNTYETAEERRQRYTNSSIKFNKDKKRN